MHKDESADEGRSLLSNRTAEVVVALLLLGVCTIVIFDSTRLGFHWREGEGPAPGYFPFYIAVVLGISSLINLLSALRGVGGGETFVAMRPFGRVLAVLIPSIVFVGLIQYIGIYLAAATFILLFMVVIGRENPLKALAIGVAVPLALFFMFEKWFLVPLPKGPVEAWLGF
ncbi:MAG: tripartite tricarboxylate transporter TctB family protein [Hyphomicrobiaceae bacterium]|nr:MAG: tripartite tricarboxylate transporter TctB family protein [Hyphomicrobiaceae bacterium]